LAGAVAARRARRRGRLWPRDRAAGAAGSPGRMRVAAVVAGAAPRPQAAACCIPTWVRPMAVVARCCSPCAVVSAAVCVAIAGHHCPGRGARLRGRQPRVRGVAAPSCLGQHSLFPVSPVVAQFPARGSLGIRARAWARASRAHRDPFSWVRSPCGTGSPCPVIHSLSWSPRTAWALRGRSCHPLAVYPRAGVGRAGQVRLVAVVPSLFVPSCRVIGASHRRRGASACHVCGRGRCAARGALVWPLPRNPPPVARLRPVAHAGGPIC